MQLARNNATVAALILVFGAGVSAASAQQMNATGTASSVSSLSYSSSGTGDKSTNDKSYYPDSPGVLVAQAQESAPANSQSALAPSRSQTQTPANTQPAQSDQSSPQKPVGTAAAEPVRASGIAASQPAGTAVAPGKQRRVRTIVISLSAIAAAGVAVGAVAALSSGTSSRPPGAH